MKIINFLEKYTQILNVLKKSICSFSLVSAIQSVIIYFYILLMTHYSSVAEYALYRELIYTNDFTIGIALFGFNLLIMRESKEFLFKNFLGILFVIICFSLIIYCILAITKGFILKDLIRVYILLLSSILYQLSFFLLVKYRKNKLALILSLSSLLIAIIGLLILFYTNTLTSSNIITLRTIVLLVFITPLFFKYTKYLPKLKKPNFQIIKKIIYMASPIGLGVLLGTVTQYTDKFLLSLLDNYQLALYATASADIPFIPIIISNMSLYFIPDIQKLFKNGQLEETTQILKKILIFGWYLNVIIFTILFCNANEIISFLYSSKYIESSVLFRIISLCYLFRLIIYSQIIVALNLEHIIIKRMIIEMILQLILSFTLLKLLGIYGLAISVVLVLGLWSVPYNLHYFAKTLCCNISELLPFKKMSLFFLKCFIPCIICHYVIALQSHNTFLLFFSSTFILLIFNLKEIKYIINNIK